MAYTLSIAIIYYFYSLLRLIKKIALRKIYKINTIGIIDQGSIVNNCFSENYADVDTFGIIITPRCDIDNNKVSTIHYLPVIRFQDWIRIDFWNIYSDLCRKDISSRLTSILKKYGLSESLLKYFSDSDLKSTLKSKITKDTDYVKFEKLLSDKEQFQLTFKEISSKRKETLFNEYHKISKNIFKELKSHRRKEFYLLESWEENPLYNVVLLREIRTISFDFSTKLANGVYEHEINVLEYSKNDIKKTGNPDSFSHVVAALKSPFIEHLIQQFFLNFGRIGVEDHRINIEDQLYYDFTKLI